MGFFFWVVGWGWWDLVKSFSGIWEYFWGIWFARRVCDCFPLWLGDPGSFGVGDSFHLDSISDCGFLSQWNRFFVIEKVFT